MKKKILIVEDEPTILVGLINVVEDEGYEVITATDGEAGLQKYQEHHPHLILLDINLPKLDGFEVCKEIRATDKQTSIIMLTSKKKDLDKILGLEIGADDYVIKGEASFDELVARIKAALRRAEVKVKAKVDGIQIDFSGVSIDSKTLKGSKNGQEFDVSSKEVQIMQLFFSSEGQVVSRDVLLEEIWGVSSNTTTRTLDQFILKIRRKIEDDPSNPKHLLTIHREGYRFIASPK